MRKYLTRKIIIYLITFFIAASLDWAIPRLMPGNPVSLIVSRFAQASSGSASQASVLTKQMFDYFMQAFQLNIPWWQQYILFWRNIFTGNLGISMYLYPEPVINIILSAVPYDILFLLPSILLSFWVGNRIGAWAARSKRADNILLPTFYILTSVPYFWLGILLVWIFGTLLRALPMSGAFSYSMTPSFTFAFIFDYLKHWILPFLSLFIVSLGGWAIGMRNMIIYELESNYSRYMGSLGASQRLIRKYSYRNAILPQVTGLALQLGTIVAGAITTEIVFSYPGIGYILFEGIMNKDYPLIQGCFLFIIVGVLLANFVIDILYMFIDPRVRIAYTEG